MKYDYIIIGAGSAGCVLANRLSEDKNISVLLLEAGGKDTKPELSIPGAYGKLMKTEVDWGFSTAPQKYVDNRDIYLPRGKTLGGSSSTNAMAYVRGNKEDYNDWEKLGNKGWGYNDVLPYFIKSENNEQINNKYHGKGGELNVTFAQHFKTPLADAFVKGCIEKGISENKDYNGAEQEGAGFFQFTIKDAKRYSTATAFLKPIKDRKNLTIITKAYTKKIIIENNKAVGVEYLTGKKSEQVYCNKEVILSAGSFGSPQILMLSGIGDAGELKKVGVPVIKNVPGVGKNLQDHLFYAVTCLCNQKISLNSYISTLPQLGALVKYLFLKKGPFTISLLEAVAFLKLDKNLDRPNLQFHFAPLQVGNDGKTDFYDVTTFPSEDGFAILPTLLKPLSRGYVALRSDNPLDTLIIQPNFLEKEEDRQVLIKGYYKAKEVLMSDAFKPYRIEMNFPVDDSSDEKVFEHIKTYVETVYHPVGTCKMGNDAMAVVDQNLKVIGVEGLRVADASVMPTIVSGNTNAACIMIGEKAADLIKEKGVTKSNLKEAQMA
jgi:choline dehydrogenase